MSTPPTKLNQLLDNSSFTIIGHRGAAGVAPENTLASFRAAFELGCPMVELDVYFLSNIERLAKTPTLDSVGQRLAVIHDDTLQRTTNRQGPTMDLAWDELATIDAGLGQGIPNLTQVFDLAKEIETRTATTDGNNDHYTPIINIELKGPATAEPVAEFIHTNNLSNVLVSSFDHKQLATFRERDTDTLVAPLFHHWSKKWQATAEQLQAAAINLSNRIVSEKRIGQISAAGYPSFVYTVNNIRRANTLKEMGVKGIFTDRPDLFLGAI